VAVDEADDVLVDLADEDHARHLHGRLVRDPVTVDEPGLDAEAPEVARDLGPAAVDDDRPHSHQAEQDHVLGELVLEPGRRHRRAAVLDDQGRPPEAADVRHRLEQGLHRLLLSDRHRCASGDVVDAGSWRM